MPEIVYVPEVRCEVSEGLLDADITVCVKDVKGCRQFLHVTPTMVNYYDGQPYLPVGLIHVDHKGRCADRTARRGGFGHQSYVDAIRVVPARKNGGTRRMILSDREIQAALKLGLILIEPEPEPSLFSSTSLDLTLKGTLLRWNDPHPLPMGQPNKLRPTGGGFDLRAVMDDPQSTTRHFRRPADANSP